MNYGEAVKHCRHTHVKGSAVVDGVRWLLCAVCKRPVVKTATVVHR